MHTSRYSGYHINASRDYVTDGEESHRAPSDRTVSEYIVANEHTTMVIPVSWISKLVIIRSGKYSNENRIVTALCSIHWYILTSRVCILNVLASNVFSLRWSQKGRITPTSTTGRRTGDPGACTTRGTRSCPGLPSTVYIRYARVPRTAASATTVRTSTSPVLRTELPLTSGRSTLDECSISRLAFICDCTRCVHCARYEMLHFAVGCHATA